MFRSVWDLAHAPGGLIANLTNLARCEDGGWTEMSGFSTAESPGRYHCYRRTWVGINEVAVSNKHVS